MNNQTKKKVLDIDFMYMDLSTCEPCTGADTSLDQALTEVSALLKASNVELNVRKILVENEEQARELKFNSSPTIRFNGRDIKGLDRDSKTSCNCVGELSGQDDLQCCSLWEYQGKSYTVPPKALLVDAILRMVYGKEDEVLEAAPSETEDIPDVIKQFYDGKEEKGRC